MNASLQSIWLRIVAQVSPDAIRRNSYAGRASSTRPARLLARRPSSIRSVSDSVIVITASIMFPC